MFGNSWNSLQQIPIKPEVQTYKLEEANKALIELKEGNIQGAKVLVIA